MNFFREKDSHLLPIIRYKKTAELRGAEGTCNASYGVIMVALAGS